MIYFHYFCTIFGILEDENEFWNGESLWKSPV